MRVAILSRRVHPAHGPGGLERHVHDQVLFLADAGVRVELISETPSPERRAAAERALGAVARLHWIAPGRLPLGRLPGTVILDRVTNYPAWARRAAAAIPADVDIVHVHGLAGLGAAERRSSGTLRTPLVLTTHGMEEFVAPPLKRLLYARFRRGMRTIAGAADATVITDEVLVPLVRDSLDLPPERCVVIPNVIDAEACRQAADVPAAEALLRELGLQGASPLFVSIGRLAANKGFATLAAALGRVAAGLPSGWAWVLVGEGPARAEIRAAVRRAGVEGRVRLAGALPEKTKHGLLARADWFVHPTLYEGSSLATLEAMAHALPVLATRAGGIPDKVRDGVSGLLVEPGDVAGLAAALLEATAMDGAAAGSVGRRTVAERFDRPVAVRGLLELYHRLRGRAGAPRPMG